VTIDGYATTAVAGVPRSSSRSAQSIAGFVGQNGWIPVSQLSGAERAKRTLLLESASASSGASVI
jgi:hypothetical protein